MEILHGRLLGVDDDGTVRGTGPRGDASTYAVQGRSANGSRSDRGEGSEGEDLGEGIGVWGEPEGTGTEQSVRGEPQPAAGRRVFPKHLEPGCARLVSVFLPSYR